ncbi:MAG: hypothetical protein NTV08_01690 [Verrucomicrobia bacterium]|nr:hypothetical protein [Verrucomicrobiota bacterium]
MGTGVRVSTVLSGFYGLSGLHFRQLLKHPVGGRHFEHAADMFVRLEFGAVGRQRQHADPFGQLWVAGRKVESRLVGDDDVLRLRFDGPHLLEKHRGRLLADAAEKHLPAP